MTVQGQDSACQLNEVCYSLPANCLPYSPCNFTLQSGMEECIGVAGGGAILYSAGISLTNNYNTDVDINLSSLQGIVGVSSLHLTPNETNNLSFVFQDTLPYDGYVCINAQATSPETDSTCESVVCFALKDDNTCLNNFTGNYFDACIDQQTFIGYDAHGYPEYLINYHFDNEISNPNDPYSDVQVSLVSSDGMTSAITPVHATYGVNYGTFVYTNTSGYTSLCVELVLTQKENQPYSSWAIDYTVNTCLCIQLPSRSALRKVKTK
jgi:hypothetical protein